MLKAMKGKRVIRIPTDKKDSYIALGYSITDMEGFMIQPGKVKKLPREKVQIKLRM